jgi:hypothetical protein
MINCQNCNKQTNNPKFCSRSCAAKITNKIPKKKKTKKCATCTNLVLSQIKYCKNCIPRALLVDENMSIGSFKSKRAYQRHSRIRTLARSKYLKSSKSKVCVICGYDKHIEICHIHAIKDFSLTTPLKIVNDLNNLIALCPNHHWEFDNNLISL